MKTSCSSLFSSSSNSSSTTSANFPKKYDVFLSFRGKDTRNNFTSHLYFALRRKGFQTFLDDKKLGIGKVISPELVKAIEDSRCSIIVLSENYASSTWCLQELVHIVNCMETSEQIVLPIFYRVNPSDVRNLAGVFGQAFNEHEQAFRDDLEKVHKWRAALTQIASLSGWCVDIKRNEAELLLEITKHLTNNVLNATSFNIPEDFLGMNSRLEELDMHVAVGQDDVRIIGIWGMGGIGKTTLAHVYYKRMFSQFDGSSFLVNDREVTKKHNIIFLQKQLLSEVLKEEHEEIWNLYKGEELIRRKLCHKKVLVVIDDVDELDQLKYVVGKNEWFGSGSRIIVTTRDESLLKRHGVSSIYELSLLECDVASQLFYRHASSNLHSLNEEHMKLAKPFVEYANGLPLALEVLGSFLCDKSITEWENAWNRLRVYPKREIVAILRISFDGLEEHEKNMFLYIACFFNKRDKRNVFRALECCGFYPNIGMRTLISKSLLSIRSDKSILMHELVEEMGKEIVREKFRKNHGRLSKVWTHEDLLHVSNNCELLEGVKALVLREVSSEMREALSGMKNLTLLILDDLSSDTTEFKSLPNKLRYLHWSGYPSHFLPSSFQPDALVELQLPFSHVEQLWDSGIKPLENLKVMHLCYSQHLKKILEFNVVPNLEKLFLKGCSELLEIDASITNRGNLTILDLKDCVNLINIPDKFSGLESLNVLNLKGCTKLNKLPEDLEQLKYLEGVDVRGTSIQDLPSFPIADLDILEVEGCCFYMPSSEKIKSFRQASLFLNATLRYKKHALHSRSI